MKLEQIFYGRGDHGYAILGASFPEGAIAARFKALCGKIGTPAFEREEDDCPFLLQERFGEVVLMVCGRTGSNDPLGRRTLFFHGLVAETRVAQEAGVTALTLWRAGCFTESVPPAPLSAVTFAPPSVASEGPQAPLQVPAVIRCRRGENLKALEHVSPAALAGDWASFSWNPLENYLYYGLDASRGIVAIPSACHVYDPAGTLLRAPEGAAPPPADEKKAAEPHPPVPEPPEEVPVRRSLLAQLALMLVTVVAVLFGLAFLIYVVGGIPFDELF